MVLKPFRDFHERRKEEKQKQQQQSPRNKKKRLLLKFTSLLLLLYYTSDHVLILINSQYKFRHRLSISLPDGDCLWTEGLPLPLDSDPYGTLLASYPAAGMRDLWKQVEGVTGIKVGDAYRYSGDRVGILKTQYPHYEGIWSYGATLDQIVLLVRNPRWNLPSFHHYLHEVNYGQTFEEVNEYVSLIFTQRSPMENWIKWRDLNFENELNLWSWVIDFYMEGGPQYWQDLDFHRVGHKPLYFRDPDDRPWPIDPRCTDCMDCVPAALVSYERLKNETTGPGELHKVANVLRDKKGMTVLSEESIDCIWHETWIKNTAPSDADRGGLPEGSYGFTNAQMEQILITLQEMRNKYSIGEQWTNHSVAMDLVSALDEYIDEVSEELEYLRESPSPTPPSDPSYYDSLVEWYRGLGKGDRYDVDLARSHPGFWDQVKDLYNKTEQTLEALPAPAPTQGAVASEPC